MKFSSDLMNLFCASLLFLASFFSFVTDCLLRGYSVTGNYWSHEADGFVPYTPSFKAMVVSMCSYLLGIILLFYFSSRLELQTPKAKGWEGFIGYDVIRYFKRKLRDEEKE